MKTTCLMLIFLGLPTYAQGSFFAPRRPIWGETTRTQQSFISPSEAMRIAQRQTGGQPLSAKLIQSGSSGYYLVKVLRDGRVSTVTVSASR